EGVLRFYQSRYLHVDVDLLLREAATRRVASADSSALGIRIYRISARRRIRSGHVNYFDHPKFGALVRVAPVE
ncbi:MAG: CsiV family protein, partial [Acidiferrobacterales bacterium]